MRPKWSFKTCMKYKWSGGWHQTVYHNPYERQMEWRMRPKCLSNPRGKTNGLGDASKMTFIFFQKKETLIKGLPIHILPKSPQ